MKVYTEQQARDASQRIASALGDGWIPAPVTPFEAADGATGYTCGASGAVLVGEGEAVVRFRVQVILLDAGADPLALDQVRQQVERTANALRRSEVV